MDPVFTQLHNEELLSPPGGGKVSKQKIILVYSVFLIVVSACGSYRDELGTTEPQVAGTQTTPNLEDESPPAEQLNPYSEIQTLLRTYPPCSGNQEIRKGAILALDQDLKDDSPSIDQDIAIFYNNMMGFVESEINEPVLTGIRIWSMYNHGFIVKTPSTIFAFDLVDGYPMWNYHIPNEILEKIQVLFISHKHTDHRSVSIIQAITGFGGAVVVPSEDKTIGYDTINLSPDEEVTVAGLQVKAFDGLHGPIPIRIFQVTTPEGLKIMHTGDNQTSETLPAGVTVDILLLNAWVNETGFESPVVGVNNSIIKLTPKLTILGHIQERSHYYDPTDPKGRLPYELPLAVDDELLPGEVSVQIWGEHCDYQGK